MGVFSRVKVEHAEDLSNKAKMRGLEHQILPLAGRYNKWATFQFTTDRGKASFDKMAREEGFELEGDSVAKSMLDAVVAGASAKSVLDEALTPGLKRAYHKNGSGRSCSGCGLTLPRYPGGYPKSCPECNNPITNGNGE